MQTELIIVSEYCHKCHIEPSFIVSELPDVERYSRMYYDLSFNMEGIDAIHHLLERMEEMKREMDSLRKQLTLYRKREIEDTDW